MLAHVIFYEYKYSDLIGETRWHNGDPKPADEKYYGFGGL
jgi:hypothetical protein